MPEEEALEGNNVAQWAKYVALQHSSLNVDWPRIYAVLVAWLVSDYDVCLLYIIAMSRTYFSGT